MLDVFNLLITDNDLENAVNNTNLNFRRITNLGIKLKKRYLKYCNGIRKTDKKELLT